MEPLRTDRDAIVRLETRFEALSEQFRLFAKQQETMTQVLEQVRDTLREATRDIKDLKSGQSHLDIRVATLEQQVDSLRDEAEKAKAVTEAISKQADKRAKQWATVSGLIVFFISYGPTIIAWLEKLLPSKP